MNAKTAMVEYSCSEEQQLQRHGDVATVVAMKARILRTVEMNVAVATVSQAQRNG